jgi:RNA ligase
MTIPPPYPRMPYLVGDASADTDQVLPAGSVATFLDEDVVVEEKLDGANVTLWIDDDESTVQVAGRAGPGAMDRGAQLGPLRAWAAHHADQVRALLDGGWALYAEWLWRTHGVYYDDLPDYLVGIDLWHPDEGFADLGDRDRRLEAAGLARPPALYLGALKSLQALEALLPDPSRWSSRPAEGLVVRRLLPAGEPRLAKYIAPTFSPRSDQAWKRGRTRNRTGASS